MDSQHGEILALQDKLQGATTALLDFQNRSRENFVEQQQELEFYKTEMTELQCEKEARHDRIHSGGYDTGLLKVDLTESGQDVCWYVMTAEEPELQGETQFTETQVEVTQIEQRVREYVLNAGEPADEERHGTESAGGREKQAPCHLGWHTETNLSCQGEVSNDCRAKSSSHDCRAVCLDENSSFDSAAEAHVRRLTWAGQCGASHTKHRFC